MRFPEQFRAQCAHLPDTAAGDPYGYFYIPARHANGRALQIIASDGSEAEGWNHVSVSIPGRSDACPSWPEMCLVKDLFFEPEECVVQFHPPRSTYINNHPGCLHLWSYTPGFPQPPKHLVGI